MSEKEDVHIIPLEVKARYEAVPILIYPPGYDYVTVWKKPAVDEYLVAGKFVRRVEKDGGVIGLAYRKLTPEEGKLVEQYIRETLRKQNAVIRYYVD